MNRLFSRRLSVLLLFGAAHFIFLWFGDILHTYALAGFFLLLFYRRKTKTLLIWAFSLLFVFHALISLQFFAPASMVKEYQMMDEEKEQKITDYVDMYQNANYVDWISYRLETELIPTISNLPIILFPVLAMFLFGLYAGKIGIFQNATAYLPQIKKIWGITLVLSIPLVTFLACLKLDIIDYGVYTQNAIQLFTSLSGLTLCFFYTSSIMLLLRKELWQKLLRPLAFTGQMALTNYLTQTFISTFIFLGLNYFGKVSLVTGTLICLVIYACQIGFSYVWLKNFRFGPFEWLWRSLTYGYFQSMKKEEKKSEVTNDVV